MRVLVIHHRWGYGGGVTVFYYTIKALVDAGFDVTISTVDSPDPRSYMDIVGEPLPSSVRFAKALDINVRMFTLYKGFFSLRQAYRGDYDVIVVTHGYPFFLGDGELPPLVYYMHFPYVLSLDPRWDPESSRYVLRGPSSSFSRFLFSIPLWLYSRPYVVLSRILYKSLLSVTKRILVNSSYTLRALKYTLTLYNCCYDILGRTSILYPPLPRAHEYISARGGSRLPCVITIGRFSSEKNYELVLEVARILDDILFVIAGGVYGRASRAYYEKIKREATPNVRVLANIPHSLKLKLLSKCTVYLHTMVGEHFGIAPLEALAAGMTPVVPRRSGTWTDVCLDGEYCYGFNSLDPREVAEMVREALEKPRVAPLEHIEKFTPERFEKGIVEVVEDVAGGGEGRRL